MLEFWIHFQVHYLSITIITIHSSVVRIEIGKEERNWQEATLGTSFSDSTSICERAVSGKQAITEL